MMSLIHELSNPSIRGEIDLFSFPSTDTTVDYSVYSSYQPVVNVASSGSKIEFRIPANGNQYIDLHDSFIYIKIKVCKKDGSNISDAADVSTTNLLLHSLFSQVDVYLNSTLVSTSNNVYPYKAYIETLLSYGADYKASQGTCALFYPDNPTGDLAETNLGYKSRKEKIAGSRWVELIDRLRFDLSTQNRYLLNDVNINISLTRSSDLFSLLTPGTDTDYKILFDSALFYVRRQILYPSLILAHQKLLESGQNARYPYKQTQVKYFTIASGSSSSVEENLFPSTLPSRIVLGFCSSSAFNGDIKKNPFNFSSYNVNYISLSVNNISMPIHPLTFNFSDNNYLLAYYMLFTSTGIAGQDFGLCFDRDTYKTNNCLFTFDLVQPTGDDTNFSLEKTGTIKLEIRFSQALTEAVHCIVYSENQAVLEIDKFRQVKQ